MSFVGYTQIQLRNDTSANWTSNNPVLSQGEPGVESDTGRVKVGDGSTSWTSLPYFGATYFASALAALPPARTGAWAFTDDGHIYWGSNGSWILKV